MRRNTVDRILQGAIALLLVGLLWVVNDTMRERVVVVGDDAPDFSITAENGRTITPTSFGGRLLVLNFWATWCPPCVDEVPSLEKFHRTLAGKGVVVLGISVDKDAAVYKRFIDQTKISFATARDDGKRINLDYGTVKFPETYIISKGKVVRKIISSRDWMDPEMIRDVESLL
ncbi:MAG: TlpA family protein disulfide reductase [Bryobacteraceae bacterium]